jgi:aspartate/methionine/tyrosine aminotransferase
VRGALAVRQEIATLYKNLHEEHILCFAGAEDAIFCTIQSIVQPNDHVIVPTPCYQSLEDLPRHLGARVTTIPLREEENWQLNLEEVRKAVTPQTKLIIVNFPHNPTGSILSETQTIELIRIANECNAYLLADEVYRPLGPSSTKWAPPVASLYKRGISLGVLSKSFGLAGLRVGWIATEDVDLLHKSERVKHYTSICNSAPSEALSLIALRAKERILQRNVTIVDHNLALLDAFFVRHKDLFRWVRPEGGCVGYVKYHQKEPVTELAEKLVKTKGVLLMPASVYGSGENYFRIGFGRQNMPEALSLFEEFLSG